MINAIFCIEIYIYLQRTNKRGKATTTYTYNLNNKRLINANL